MHVGLVMECDYREGRTQEEAFAEAMSIAEIAETQGLDGVWLAERHFAMHRRPTDPMGAGIPSIASVPLVLAAAIAARTTRLRIGTGVSVLPLCHPIRTAEEAATVDQISQGRLDFGVGRSGFPRAYSGYGVRYDESRERFQESLEVILKAWTQEGFSHTGKYFAFDNLTVVPRPYQKPHPPIWVAATTHDTFPMVGRMGFSLVTGLRGFDVPEATRHLNAYRTALREAGHAGDGNIYLRIPVYVAATGAQAHAEPEESTMRSYRRLAEKEEKKEKEIDKLIRAEQDQMRRLQLEDGRTEQMIDLFYDPRHMLGVFRRLRSMSRDFLTVLLQKIQQHNQFSSSV